MGARRGTYRSSRRVWSLPPPPAPLKVPFGELAVALQARSKHTTRRSAAKSRRRPLGPPSHGTPHHSPALSAQLGSRSASICEH